MASGLALGGSSSLPGPPSSRRASFDGRSDSSPGSSISVVGSDGPIAVLEASFVHDLSGGREGTGQVHIGEVSCVGGSSDLAAVGSCKCDFGDSLVPQ